MHCVESNWNLISLHCNRGESYRITPVAASYVLLMYHIVGYALRCVPHRAQLWRCTALLYRWSWGSWGGSLKCAATATASTSQVFECWALAHWMLMWKEINRLHHVSNDVVISDWVRTYVLRHLEFHDWTLDLSLQCSKLANLITNSQNFVLC